jgi:site-specific DNA recombinase
MRKVFGYIRVSTPKQGSGVSLQEQKDAITRYCQRSNLDIAAWFEERETAAKRGRPIFTQILSELRQGKADGVVIHKIDRSARNLRDWADLGELIDQGIEVHFANDSLDLHSRGGRLSADIQAVVAADYIRNLREETRKGFYGRIKQGLYPLPAPLGYLDKGKGKPKEFDPVKAPLVRKAFELYATGGYNLDTLSYELFRLGLRRGGGSRIPRSSLADMFKNPFYIGLIYVKRTQETFPGIHPQLVSKSLFGKVQQVLDGKFNTRAHKHDLLFRRMLRCKRCGYTLVGERQKGHTYYRCHMKDCSTKCIREEDVESQILAALSRLEFSQKEKEFLRAKVDRMSIDWTSEQEALTRNLHLRLDNTRERLNKLTDAYIDGIIEKEIFQQRKEALLMEQKEVEEKLGDSGQESQSIPERLSKFLELAGSAYLQYKMGLPEQKRDLVKIVTSNRQVDGKKLDITFSIPFNEVANRFENANGGPYRAIPRTWDQMFNKLYEYFIEHPTLMIGARDNFPEA